MRKALNPERVQRIMGLSKEPRDSGPSLQTLNSALARDPSTDTQEPFKKLLENIVLRLD